MVGMRIAELRRQWGMTQRELAGRLAVSTSAIGMYEQGRRQPSADLIVAVSEIFGVSTQWLLTGRLYSGENLCADLKMLTRYDPEHMDAMPLPTEGELHALLSAIQQEMLAEPKGKTPGCSQIVQGLKTDSTNFSTIVNRENRSK